jgi:uncharacterized protein YigA (DUF484 family)
MSEDKTSLEDVVADYLRNNPRFLDRHPDVLEALEVNHRIGTASSLIERQVGQLRSEKQQLEKRLTQLTAVAAENEQLIRRLQRLTLELVPIDSRQAFFTHLGNTLLNDFNADILQICLLDANLAAEAGEDVRHVEPDNPEFEAFSPLLQKAEATCGRLNEAKMEFLFGSKSRWVQSIALMPLGEEGSLGLMAIGSSDQNRFYPGMGTLFLDLLAEVISTRLTADPPEEQRRSA